MKLPLSIRYRRYGWDINDAKNKTIATCFDEDAEINAKKFIDLANKEYENAKNTAIESSDSMERTD